MTYFLEFSTTRVFQSCLESQLLTSDLLRAFNRYLDFLQEYVPLEVVYDRYGEVGAIDVILATERDCSHLIPLTGRYRLVSPSPVRGDSDRFYSWISTVQVYEGISIGESIPVRHVPARAGGGWSSCPCLYAEFEGFSVSRSTGGLTSEQIACAASLIRSALASRNSGELPLLVNAVKSFTEDGYIKLRPRTNKERIIDKSLWLRFLDGDLGSILGEVNAEWRRENG